MVASVRLYAILFLISFAPQVAQGQSAKIPKLVVIPVKSKPNLASSARPLEAALEDHADIEKLKVYQKAAKKLNIKSKDIGTAEAATKVGAQLGLSHVVLLAGKTERVANGKKKKKVTSAVVTLVRVDTGEEAWSGTYALKGKKVTKDVAQQIASEIAEKLAPPAAVPEPESDAPPAATEAVAPPPAPTEPSAEAAAAEPTLEPAEAKPEGGAETAEAAPLATEEPAAASADAATAEATQTPGTTVAQAPPEKTEPESAVEGVARRAHSSNKARPALEVRLGGYGFLRRGAVKEKSSSDKLTYGGSQLLGAGLLQVAFYPLAFDGKGAWFEGLGLVLEGLFTQAATEVRQNPSVVVKSNVLDAKGALAMRLVLWDSPTATELQLRAGYSFFQFPLSESAFPGVAYSGPLVGVTAVVPFVKAFGLLVSGDVVPALSVSGAASQLGQVKSGLRFDGDFGFRLSFAPVQVDLVGRFSEADVQFSGASQLSTSSPFTDASLSDRIFGLYLTAGMTL